MNIAVNYSPIFKYSYIVKLNDFRSLDLLGARVEGLSFILLFLGGLIVLPRCWEVGDEYIQKIGGRKVFYKKYDVTLRREGEMF